MRWWHILLLVLGGLALFEVIGHLVNRWYYMRARDLSHIAGVLETLINLGMEGSALNVYSPDLEVCVRFEKSSGYEGDYCQLVFSENGENADFFSTVEAALSKAGLALEVVSSRVDPISEEHRDLVSVPIHTSTEAARAAEVVFDAVGVDPDAGLRFKSEGRDDMVKAWRKAGEQLGHGWWRPW